MNRYLRFLSLCYFIGFSLHILDLFNLRLHFSEMTNLWKSWISFLAVADFWTAIGLWHYKSWGIRLFQGVAILQIIAYCGIIDSPKNQLFLIGFHIVTLGIYFALARGKSSSTKLNTNSLPIIANWRNN